MTSRRGQAFDTARLHVVLVFFVLKSHNFRRQDIVFFLPSFFCTRSASLQSFAYKSPFGKHLSYYVLSLKLHFLCSPRCFPLFVRLLGVFLAAIEARSANPDEFERKNSLIQRGPADCCGRHRQYPDMILIRFNSCRRACTRSPKKSANKFIQIASPETQGHGELASPLLWCRRFDSSSVTGV